MELARKMLKQLRVEEELRVEATTKREQEVPRVDRLTYDPEHALRATNHPDDEMERAGDNYDQIEMKLVGFKKLLSRYIY